LIKILWNQKTNLSANSADDKALHKKLEAAAKANIQLVFIILPENIPTLYSRINYYGDIKYGVRTVCVIGSKFLKPQGQPQHFANVALKFNLKLGDGDQLTY
jgi:eukaryotic translation initiation factor 2C